MSIGKMDKRIELKQNIRTPDGAGGYSTALTTVATVWAEEVKPSYRTLQEAGATVSELNRTFKIRARADVRKGWKAVLGTRTMDVQHAYDPDRTTTVLVCREVVK